ncbi:MAG: hypothetical protein WC867_08565 [Candidatus Pacearchaeota archaeon]|jgi:hypothetical protein
MAVNDTLLREVTPKLISDVEFIVTILEAVGIIFILYLVYIIVNAYITYKNNKRIRHIESQIDKMDDKINFLIEKEKEKELEIEKSKHHKIHKRK